MTADAPQGDLLAARALLDDALIGLRRVDAPGFPVAPTVDRVSRALHHVYEALAARGDWARMKEHSNLSLEHARDALMMLQFKEHEDEPLLDTMRFVAQAMGIVRASIAPLDASLDLPRGDAVAPPRASHAEPRVIRRPRLVISPAVAFPSVEHVEVEIPEIIIEPVTVYASREQLARLGAEAEAMAAAMDGTADAPAPAPREDEADDREASSRPPLSPAEIDEPLFGRRLDPREVLLERANDFLEELGTMSLIRKPGAGFDWNDLASVEDRLLARVDAILACGEWVLPHLVATLDDRPVADAELTWALVFLFGSLAGDDAFDQVVRLVRTSDLEDEGLFDALAEALCHAPHPRLEEQLRAWTRAGTPRLRALAVRALGLRRALHAEAVGELLRDADPGVALEAARAASRAVGRLDHRHIGWMIDHEDERFVVAGFEAGIACGASAVMFRARELTRQGRGGWGRATVYLALCGDGSFKDVLREQAAASSDSVVIEALGWYGDLELVGYLIGRLRAGDLSALVALQRLTGASLTDDDPAPEYERGGRPFEGPRRVPVFEPELSADADVWEAWWERHRGRADLRLRHRFGHPFGLDDCRWEIESAPAENADRWRAYLELMARTGASLPFDPHAFAPTQRRQLAQWWELVDSGRGRYPLGAWQTSMRG